MDRREILKKISNVFKSIFNCENAEISEDTTFLDIEDWDSIGHIRLIASLESEFGIKIPNEIIGFKDIKSIVDFFEEKTSSFNRKLV